jgi:hypothetical protein
MPYQYFTKKNAPLLPEPTCVDDSHARVVVVLKVRGILSANAGSRNGNSFILFSRRTPEEAQALG